MPEFRAGKPRWDLSLSADYSHAAGLHVVPFNVDVHSEGGVLLSAGVVTIDRPGGYVVGARTVTGTIGSGAIGRLELLVNGSTYAAASGALNNGQALAMALSQLVQLAAGDTIALALFRSGTSAVTVQSAYSRFWGSRAAPERWT